MARAPFRLTVGAALLTALALSACVPSVPQPTPAPQPAPAPAPAPRPAPQPAPPVPSNWMDAAQTPGDWRYTPLGGGGRASFVDPAGTVLFDMICTGARQITLARAGAGGSSMIVRAEAAERSLPATPANGAATAVLGAGDSLLDAVAFSKGRFAIEVGSAPPLFLPAWPEVTRVVEDCR
ncbi:hypothetical protein [Croceibacterium ferulae]|uniref:hypothetical protein n=1 Tax=Croceibacterium ferulae TaxID=1854641 RepID=UPI000EADBB19|nr:hypothetical protein [Croceibacterium ferulae]